MKIVLLLLIIQSCAWNRFHQKTANRHLERIETEFNQVAAKNNVTLPKIKYHFAVLKEVFPKSENWAGACAKGNNIYLDIRWWNNSHSLDKEQVVLHELGHCALGLKHGLGLMGQDPIESSFYLKNKQRLIQDLFDAQLKLKDL